MQTLLHATMRRGVSTRAPTLVCIRIRRLDLQVPLLPPNYANLLLLSELRLQYSDSFIFHRVPSILRCNISREVDSILAVGRTNTKDS